MESKASSSVKYEIEKFNGKNSFNLWQGRMLDLLSQQGIAKALYGKTKKPATMSDEDWEELETRVCGAIRLNLFDAIAYPLLYIRSPGLLWTKLESLYMTKSLTNKLYLRKQLFLMRMKDADSLHTHLNNFNRAVADLESVDYTVDKLDKVLLFVGSLNKQYEPLGKTLLHAREDTEFDDVVAVLLSDELMNKDNSSVNEESNSLLANADGSRRRSAKRGNGNRNWSKSRGKGVLKCFYCNKEGHFKRDCMKRKDDLAKKQGDNND